MKRSRNELGELDEGAKMTKTINTHRGAHLSGEQKLKLRETAQHLASRGKGITACDESSGTIGKRFEAVGIDNTEDNRRAYREMLFTAEGADKFLCGAILDPETLTQSTKSGESFVKVLQKRDIIPGVKPHLKVYVLPGTSGDTVMQGLDSLADRLNMYVAFLPSSPASLSLAITRILTISSLFSLLYSPSLLTLPYPTLPPIPIITGTTGKERDSPSGGPLSKCKRI